MITLEQIRLLESKITRAIDLIRILKDENSTLRKGLESAQKRMRELETLVDGFKTDQKEIESVIVRTLHNLDELEESAGSAATADTVAGVAGGVAGGIRTAAAAPQSPASASRRAEPRTEKPATAPTAASASPVVPAGPADDPPASKEELDIF